MKGRSVAHGIGVDVAEAEMGALVGHDALGDEGSGFKAADFGDVIGAATAIEEDIDIVADGCRDLGRGKTGVVFGVEAEASGDVVIKDEGSQDEHESHDHPATCKLLQMLEHEGLPGRRAGRDESLDARAGIDGLPFGLGSCQFRGLRNIFASAGVFCPAGSAGRL